MEQIPDEVFSTGALGTCCGINPKEGKVYAPADGKVSVMMDSLHAVGMELPGGVELLIHVGIDTVDMEGKGFTSHTSVGKQVKKGDLLLEMDLNEIHNCGHKDTVIMVITNSGDFDNVSVVAKEEISMGNALMQIENS